MKQVIVLEIGDLKRLKNGEMLQLTGNLLLSMEGGRRRINTLNGSAVEQPSQKALSQRKYRERHKKPRAGNVDLHECPECGRGFDTRIGLGIHRRIEHSVMSPRTAWKRTADKQKEKS